MNAKYAQRLKLWRKNMGLSQRALAEAISRSQGYIGDIEAGRSAPSREMLDRLSNVFGLNSDWVLTGRGEPVLPPVVRQVQDMVSQVQALLPDTGDIVVDTTPPLGASSRTDRPKQALVPLALFDIDDTGTALVRGHDRDGTIALSRAWFDARGIDPATCGLMRAPDDDMLPTIPFGARLVVEFAARLDGAPPVKVMVLDGRIRLRRVAVADLRPDRAVAAVILYTDARSHPPMTLTGDDLDTLDVMASVHAVIADIG